MEILLFNAGWMLWNAILALMPVGFAVLYFRTSRMFSKFVLAVMWLLFLPNTLYVISDMEHIITQWAQVSLFEKIILIAQYASLEVVGLTAFILALYPFEKELRRRLKKSKRQSISTILITMNFVIGFAMVIGKIDRVNSWDVFSNTESVITALAHTVCNDAFVWLGILFSLFGIFFYFLFRNPVVAYFRQYTGLRRLTNKKSDI